MAANQTASNQPFPGSALTSAGHSGPSARPLSTEAPGLLTTQRLMFRMVRPSDEAALLDAAEPMRAQLEDLGLWKPDESPAQYFARQLAMCEAGEDRGLAFRRIAILGDATIVGGFNLISITRGLEFECEANWWVAPALRRRGLATEAVQALLDHALTESPRGLGLHAVRAHIRPDNEASRRVARRAGMRLLPGRTRVPVGDRWVDHEVWKRSILDTP